MKYLLLGFVMFFSQVANANTPVGLRAILQKVLFEANVPGTSYSILNKNHVAMAKALFKVEKSTIPRVSGKASKTQSVVELDAPLRISRYAKITLTKDADNIVITFVRTTDGELYFSPATLRKIVEDIAPNASKGTISVRANVSSRHVYETYRNETPHTYLDASEIVISGSRDDLLTGVLENLGKRSVSILRLADEI